MQMRFVFYLLILLGSFSCVKQEAGDFQLEYFMNMEIPANATPWETHYFEQRITSSWIQFLQEHNLAEKDINSVKPRSIILSPIFDNSISYDIISEAHVYVYPIDKLSENLPIAEIFDPVGDPNELVFLPGLANIKDIVTQPEFMLRLKLNLRGIPGSVSEHRLIVQFDVFLN